MELALHLFFVRCRLGEFEPDFCNMNSDIANIL